jgi:hypothetical protein
MYLLEQNDELNPVDLLSQPELHTCMFILSSRAKAVQEYLWISENELSKNKSVVEYCSL